MNPVRFRSLSKRAVLNAHNKVMRVSNIGSSKCRSRRVSPSNMQFFGREHLQQRLAIFNHGHTSKASIAFFVRIPAAPLLPLSLSVPDVVAECWQSGS